MSREIFAETFQSQTTEMWNCGKCIRRANQQLRVNLHGDTSAGFGWNVVDPGHGLVFANARRPQDAAAAAPLSATGTYGPLLLLTDAGVLPQPLQDYLLDIQPGYTDDPVRGVYNHGWIIGDETANLTVVFKEANIGQ